MKLLSQFIPTTSVKEIDNDIKFEITPPTFWQRFFNTVGLTLQSIGHHLYFFGNKIHCAESPLSFLIIIVKPILLLFFKLETLKNWKNKLFSHN